MAIAGYTAVTYLWIPIRRALGWLMLPLGQAALYSYIVHFFLILLVYNLAPWLASLPWEPSEAVFTPAASDRGRDAAVGARETPGARRN